MAFRELSDTEKRGNDLYERAMRLLNKGRSLHSEDKKIIYKLLDEAAELKNKEAMKLMGWLLNIGRYIGKASLIFLFFHFVRI